MILAESIEFGLTLPAWSLGELQEMIRHEVCIDSSNWVIPGMRAGLTSPTLLDRTSELRKKGYIGRRLGPKQMTTDTAVRVTRMVVHERGQRD